MLPTLDLLPLPDLEAYKENGVVCEEKIAAALKSGELEKDTVVLWCQQALMVDLLHRLPQTETAQGSKETSLAHLRWMLETGSQTPMQSDKAARWLGYVQGVSTVKGWIDVSTERGRTRPLLHLPARVTNSKTPESLG